MKKLILFVLILVFATQTSPVNAAGKSIAFTAEVWADNWFALYINGKLVGEDSVPITTERSFNAERITFKATYPLTIGLIGKDFKENDSGLEYIGSNRQQIGDGGVVLQIKESKSGKVVATTGKKWRVLAIQQAPLDSECVTSNDPLRDCKSSEKSVPSNWSKSSFSDSKWTFAREYSESDVGVKDGYGEIQWDPKAKLIWGQDLKVDNTLLFRFKASGK
jgi:hypothetical protein